MRTLADMIGRLDGLIANEGSTLGAQLPPGSPNSNGVQLGSRPLGSLTGAPPRMITRTLQIIPSSAVGQNGLGPTQIVETDKASRVAIVIAPLVGFSIYVGDSGVRADPGGSGIAVPPLIPYEFILPGNQGLWAVTDAPVYLTLRIQVAAILVGDRERNY